MAATFRFTSDTFEPNLPHISFSDSEDRRLERERMMFSSDPNKVETIVSHLMKDYVPDKSKEKLAMSPTLAKVEAAMPSDDPRRGMGSKIMAESTIGIAANPDKHPLEVIKEIYDRNVEERKKATYAYLEDKEKGFLGLPGTGTSLFTGSVIGKKYANMPGYDEYKQKKDEYNRTHFTLDEFSSPQSAAALGGILTAIGVGAEKLGTSAGTIGKVARVAAKFLPTGFKAIPNPLLRVGLTALASIPEFWAFEGIHQAVTKAPGMEDVPELPKQVLGLIAGGAGMSQLSKGIAKRIDKWGEARYAANDAVNKMMQDPSLKNVVDSFDKERYMKKSAELFQDDFSMRGTPGSAAAKVGSSKAKISMEQMSRIEGKINEGLQVEDAVGQVLTEDKLLGALDAIKTNKFFDELLKSSADKQEKALKNRLFRDAVNRGLGPDEAILEVQRGTAKWELDDIINFGNNATVTHAPEVAAGLRMLGYSDEAINKIPLRMGKTLSKRRMIEANAERSKLELEGQKLFAEEAGTATEASLYDPMSTGVDRARAAIAEHNKLIAKPALRLGKTRKYNYKEVQEKEKSDAEAFRRWVTGEGHKPVEPTVLFRGELSETPRPNGQLLHVSPWLRIGDSAGKFGGGGHFVTEYPAQTGHIYYRGGSLAGDPLEITRVGSVKGVTWDEALEQAKKVYDDALAKRMKGNRTYLKDHPEEAESILNAEKKWAAEEAFSHLQKGTYEADVYNRPGKWRNMKDEHIPPGHFKETPPLRSNDEVAAWERKIAEGQKFGLSGKPKYFFAEGEPAKTADEETWYRYFKNMTEGEGGAATEANMFTFEGNIPKPLPEGTHTVRKIPESAMKAYNRVYEERLDAVHKKVVESVEADKEVVQEVIKQNYYEPTEGMKSVMSDFVTDEQYAKAMLNLEELGIGKKGDFAASTAAGVGTKKKRVATPKKVVKQVAEDAETIEAVGAENISKAGAEGKVKKEKRDFNRESVDLYTRMSQGKISQDEYDSALNSLMDEHGGGGWGKMMAAITAGAGALSALSAFAPSEAEAAGLPNGVITNANYSIVSGIKKTFKEVIKEIVDKKLFVPEYVKGTFDFGDKGYAISIIPDIMNVSAKYRSSKKMFAQQYLSPNVVADFLYNATTKDGRRLPTNPMPEIASRTAISQGNTAKAFSLVQDVLSMVTGGESHMKEVSEAMKPLLEMNMTASRVSFHRGNISKLDEMIEGLIKKKSKLSGDEALAMDGNIEKLMMMQDASNQAISELKFNKEAFDKQWRTIAEGLAEKYPSTRIALALEGEGMAANDPWVLKHLTDREKEAVGHLRKLLNKIAEYIIDVGGKPIIEKPYIHHAAHPDMDWKGLQKSLEGYSLESQNILPLSRLFHREYNSKQMMPDIHYVMQQYLPDIFKRIEMMDFWKKGKPNGWSAHMHALEQMGWRAPAEFMKSIAQGFLPEDRTWANNIARQAYALEAARLIGFNPAPGFKHLMKLEANWSNFGVKMGLTNLPKAFDIYKKEVGAAVLEKMTGKKVTRDMETELYRTFTHAGNMSAIIQDLGLYEPPRGWVEKIGRQLSDYTGTIINNTERFDRAMSFVGSMEMAAKQGMTAEQAIYNLYDTILKTNFLSGNQNPSWLRNPKVRAMMMFQGTPFKIAEQRALLAVRAGRGIKKGWDEYYKQLQDIRKMVGEGEKEFKWNLIKDALESEKDINGIPYAYQLMRKVMILGTVITGGAALFDADMTGHMLHLPFVKHEGGLKVNLNPVLSAAMETKAKEDEFWLSSFFKRWLGSAPFGAAVGKAARLKEDDIPKIYRDSKFRYFFGVPATKEE